MPRLENDFNKAKGCTHDVQQGIHLMKTLKKFNSVIAKKFAKSLKFQFVKKSNSTFDINSTIGESANELPIIGGN